MPLSHVRREAKPSVHGAMLRNSPPRTACAGVHCPDEYTVQQIPCRFRWHRVSLQPFLTEPPVLSTSLPSEFSGLSDETVPSPVQ
ncbi:hypothetical protein EVA_01868 [gut metagenome]|uniref:Uncharacterized protein n=1 Tax=gut metagenome TaxID=749906 RepID=J9GPA4_9ZZZZ